jgi:hypothetical protein
VEFLIHTASLHCVVKDNKIGIDRKENLNGKNERREIRNNEKYFESAFQIIVRIYLTAFQGLIRFLIEASNFIKSLILVKDLEEYCNAFYLQIKEILGRLKSLCESLIKIFLFVP